MRIELEPIVKSEFTYELDRKKFNDMMNIKKTADRYDRSGRKLVKIVKDKDGANVKFGKHKPERIKSDYMKGPFVMVMLSTPSSKAGDDANQNHYTKQAEIFVEEGEAARVYRDSMNDGYTNAKFCDDSVMLIVVKDKNGNKTYLQIEGEPTGYGSWNFDSDAENENEHFEEVVKQIHLKAVEKYKLPAEDVYVVIQLESV